MTANPCVNCGHLRKDHRWFMGDWSCLACMREGNRPDAECVCYVPTHIRCTCGGVIDIRPEQQDSLRFLRMGKPRRYQSGPFKGVVISGRED